MKKKNIFWAVVLSALCAAALGIWLLLRALGGGTVAVIRVDGEEYERIDLSRVEQSYDFVIETQYGRNTVHVEPGGISVTEADCPDGVCVRQGVIRSGGMPIICMPHRLVIEIEGGPDA